MRATCLCISCKNHPKYGIEFMDKKSHKGSLAEFFDNHRSNVSCFDPGEEVYKIAGIDQEEGDFDLVWYREGESYSESEEIHGMTLVTGCENED